MKRKFFAGIMAAMLAVIPATAASASSHTAQVVVVHGVPGLEVDILIDGVAAIEGFSFADDPVITDLPAGTYTLGVAPTGTTDAVLELEATLTAGTSVTVAAFLDRNSDPQLQAFQNQNSATGIQPFHLADFGPVDILVGNDTVLEGVRNGQTARIDVAGGTTVNNVGIAEEGGDTADIELGDVTVPANTLVLVYALGPDDDDDLPTVVVAAIDVTSPAAEVHSGTGGLLTSGVSTAMVMWMLLALVVVATPAALAARKR